MGRDPGQAHAGRQIRQRRTPVEGGHAGGTERNGEKVFRLLKRRRWLRDYSRSMMPPATSHSDCSRNDDCASNEEPHVSSPISCLRLPLAAHYCLREAALIAATR